ncbi:MAG: thioredoxin family protein [Saccharospirillaceae bacterium]|nr:thioredoxin family protein [Pseudomonadales bacterium]NRB81002.1 thioredoxin family protein [Saccharospirillaceae bacterium]
MKNIIIIVSLMFSLGAFAFNGKPYNENYDPKRDPFSDFKLAQEDAILENKLILLVLGGDWCVWCHYLGSFITKNEMMKQSLENTFVVMKVNVSQENNNQEFLSYLPEHSGYPYFVILNEEGKVVGSQYTGDLEQDKSYSIEEFSKFIETWNEVNQKKFTP